MDQVQIMNLSSTDDSGMVSIAQSQPVEQKIPEKNIPINNKDMDAATPLDEVMGLNDLSNAPLAQDPRMYQQQPQAQLQQAMAPQVHQMPVAGGQMPGGQAQSTTGTKNPMNLTDEQMEALIVGVVAVIAFSKPVQDKLSQMVPQFVGENGSRSTAGVAISGIVAAVIFYFGRKMVMKN